LPPFGRDVSPKRPYHEFELRGAGFLGDAKLQRRAGFLHAAMAKRAEELIEENLCLAFLIALQRAGEGGELPEGGFQLFRGHKEKNVVSTAR
jgi:hypothetical protein